MRSKAEFTQVLCQLSPTNYPVLNPTDSILKAVALLHYKKLRAIPVIQNDKILGILTRNSICNIIAKQ